MAKLHTIEKVVLQTLEEYPQSRKDDYWLMLGVCSIICPNALSYCFGAILQAHNAYNVPNWKSVERARRKIQKQRPDLVEPKTAEARRKEEEEYIEYARA